MDGIYSLPAYSSTAGTHEHTVAGNGPTSPANAQPQVEADTWASAPRRVLTNLSNRVNPPPGYTRHPQLRNKAAKKGAAWGAGLGLLAGPGAACFGIFGPGHYRGEGGYVAGKGLGVIIVGSIAAGAVVGAGVGYGLGYALGGIVDETLIVADHVQHAAHELNERFHGVRHPEAAHMA